MKQIIAKFNSKCSQTNINIRKGETIFYDYSTKKAYHVTAPAVIAFLSKSSDSEDLAYVSAHENQYFDNFCYNNNI